MATLTAQAAAQSGTALSYVAANAGGDQVAAQDQLRLAVKNGGGASITVTLTGVTACNYGVVHNVAVTVGAGAETVIGPIDRTRFANNSGFIAWTYSAVTSVTVAVLQG